MKTRAIAAIGLAVALAGGTVAGSAAAASAAPSTAGSAAHISAVDPSLAFEINIDSAGFHPRTLRVAPHALLQAFNHDTVKHTLIAQGRIFHFSLNPNTVVFFNAPATPGTYRYHDRLHPELRARIVVSAR